MSVALPGEMYSIDELFAQDPEYLEIVEAKKAEALAYQMENCNDDDFCF